MSESSLAQRMPPGPAEGFDIGSTEDSLERMVSLFEQYGDMYFVAAESIRLDSAAEDRRVHIPLSHTKAPRYCIGESFALFEMALHMDLLARRIRLRFVEQEPVEIEAAINLRPKHGLLLKPELR